MNTERVEVKNPQLHTHAIALRMLDSEETAQQELYIVPTLYRHIDDSRCFIPCGACKQSKESFRRSKSTELQKRLRWNGVSKGVIDDIFKKDEKRFLKRWRMPEHQEQKRASHFYNDNEESEKTTLLEKFFLRNGKK